MSPTEAAVLAALALHDRRLISAILRSLLGRDTADDRDALPPRLAGEPPSSWALRVRNGAGRSGPWCDDDVVRTASAQIDRATRLGIRALPLLGNGYPPLLEAIPDPPPVLWVRGQPAVLLEPAVAIVGSRAATPYGLTMAKKLAFDLASAGLVIVSGLARGVDSSAHMAALAAGGRTIGVLGCGPDRIYPAEHGELARDMQERGAVVTEFPPGVPPLPHHFPLRNRIISGLSSAVVVVEAPEKSGALITASTALEQGREVMVVPGPAAGGRNRGGHLLARDGARLVESAGDILEDVFAAWRGGSQAVSADRLIGLPESSDFTIDEVADRTGEPASVVLSRLLELELAGQIQRIGGGRFARVLSLGGRGGRESSEIREKDHGRE